MKDQITINGKKYQAIKEDRNASILQHQERELEKALRKGDEDEIYTLRNAIAYTKSKMKKETVDELKTFKAISKQTGHVVYFKNKKEMDAAFKKKLVRKIGTFESTEESVNESVNKKVTVKEIKSWMKSLEEFRYRKVKSVDARRVASFINNGLSETDLPMSLQKKWSQAKYGREKHLADKFIKEKISQKLAQNEGVDMKNISLLGIVEDLVPVKEREESVNKFEVIEAVKNYQTIGGQLFKDNGIIEVAKQLVGIAESAQNHVLSETDDWFDAVSVKRNMKELKGMTSQFKKAALEANAVNERLNALYEDMGNILNRYYDIDEAMDPVGKEDGDIDNDGDEDDSDRYLKKRRDAISKNIKKEALADPLPDRDKDGNLTNPLEIEKRKLMKQKKEKTAQIDKASGFKAKQPLIKQKQRIQQKINDINRKLGR